MTLRWGRKPLEFWSLNSPTPVLIACDEPRLLKAFKGFMNLPRREEAAKSLAEPEIANSLLSQHRIEYDAITHSGAAFKETPKLFKRESPEP